MRAADRAPFIRRRSVEHLATTALGARTDPGNDAACYAARIPPCNVAADPESRAEASAGEPVQKCWRLFRADRCWVGICICIFARGTFIKPEMSFARMLQFEHLIRVCGLIGAA